MSKPKIPEDLQLKVGTKEEAAWTATKEQTEQNTRENNMQNLINEQVIALAKKMILEEKGKV